MAPSAIQAGRIRRRREERGVALFVVVMAVTLLSAVGLFAAHSATQVDQAAGYDRLARQTQQMAEYGTIATAADFGTGAAATYLALARSNPSKCLANANRNGADCFYRNYSDIDQQTLAGAGEHLLSDQSGGVPNVIGVSTGTGDITGSFHSEVTDIGDAGLAVPGTDKGNPKAPHYQRITVTTYAQTRPLDAADCAADTTNGTSIVTAQQAMRAHLIVGPM